VQLADLAISGADMFECRSMRVFRVHSCGCHCVDKGVIDATILHTGYIPNHNISYKIATKYNMIKDANSDAPPVDRV